MTTRTVTIKRTSLRPKITARLRNSDGTFVDLTTATGVTFTMRRLEENGPDTVVLVDQPCAITNAAQGIVEYTWQAGDTDVAGAHVGDFEVTWSPGVTEIIPTKGYLNIRVLQTAGDI